MKKSPQEMKELKAKTKRFVKLFIATVRKERLIYAEDLKTQMGFLELDLQVLVWAEIMGSKEVKFDPVLQAFEPVRHNKAIRTRIV